MDNNKKKRTMFNPALMILALMSLILAVGVGDHSVLATFTSKANTGVTASVGTWKTYAELDTGSNVNAKLIKAAKNTVGTIKKVEYSDTAPSASASTQTISINGTPTVLAWYDSSDGSIKIYSSAKKSSLMKILQVCFIIL